MMSWTRGQPIGRGSTAVVSTATAHESNEVFAVKSAELARSEFLVKEQMIMACMNCPQIVSYKGWDISCEGGTTPMYNLWMEYAPHGTVADAVRLRGGSLHEDEIRSYAHQILLGLDYLHSMGIVHCDIKGQNILLTDQGAKIADFGCAKWAEKKAAPAAGTPLFLAPEVARWEQQGFPADVWAVGCTVIEMATGRVAWPDVTDPVSVLYRIGFSNDVPEIPEIMSKQGKDFLSKCLRRDPLERWTVQELLKHPFFEESVSVSVLKRPGHPYDNSPTSVLHQGIWFESETEEAKPNVPGEFAGSSADSPIERIKKLSKVSGYNEMLGWELDENWVTVRGSSDSGSLSMDEPTMASSETTTSHCRNCGLLDSIESAQISSGRESNNTTINNHSSSSTSSYDRKDLTVASRRKFNVQCVLVLLNLIIGKTKLNDSLMFQPFFVGIIIHPLFSLGLISFDHNLDPFRGLSEAHA
ncbi:mitogen-activated protein kinase kinase kinase 18-like [Punica granatum]|uniref:Protein kinase domain-containing protein n=2 Tax=Punica granatum TaxID=22663 RepID=A0A218XEP0_PUNGR|nr:mitogen-activated protein kinase kinase kinase 18-like [Punica granatum]OWM83403.1 hypothetical protein CDL15_Pgr012884 [Punica granatum]PKI48870.1 hypothetical protein CRG98_030718 [Punica granatum]